MNGILLLLASRLLRDSLRLVLAKEFCIIAEIDEDSLARGLDNLPASLACMIVDPIALKRNMDLITWSKTSFCRIVILANEAELLEMSGDHVALADGILTHELSVDAVVRSLHLVCAGERVISRDLLPIIARGPPPSRSNNEAAWRKLTPREEEVLLDLVKGHANKVIARNLGMMEATVKVHIQHLLRKINAQNRTQAVVWALANLPDRDAEL